MALGTIVFAVIMVVLTGFQNGWHSLTTVRGVLPCLSRLSYGSLEC